MSNISDNARQAAERLFEDRVFSCTLNKGSFVMCYADIIQRAIDAATADKDKVIEGLQADKLELWRGLTVAHDAMVTWFSSEYADSEKAQTIRRLIDKHYNAILHPEEKRK